MSVRVYFEEALQAFPLQGKIIGEFGEASLHKETKLFSLDTLKKAPENFFDAFFLLHELKRLALQGKDLLVMKQVQKLLKKGSLLFLSIPIGKEKIVTDSYRVYGEEGMKALFQGFRPVGYFGYSYEDLLKDPDEIHEPVFVLTLK